MAGPRYAADPASAIRRVELDGLTALFHAPSGTTHVVAPPAPQILDVLAEGAGDAEAILARMSDRFAIESDGDAAAAIAARLGELEAAGLVRRL